MRWLAKPIVWLGIILVNFALGIATGFAFYEFNELLKKNNNQIFTEFKFVADANYYRGLPITWLAIGIVSGLLLILSILILLALQKRLRKALAILKEASKAVGHNFFSLFWPFIPFVLQIGVFVYWACVAVSLSTSGKPIYRLAYNETVSNTTNILLGEICDPNKWNYTSGLSKACVFWQYGYDPKVDLDSILNGLEILVYKNYIFLFSFIWQVLVFIFNHLLSLLISINGFRRCFLRLCYFG